jgi:hypothetical protein
LRGACGTPESAPHRAHTREDADVIRRAEQTSFSPRAQVTTLTAATFQ